MKKKVFVLIAFLLLPMALRAQGILLISIAGNYMLPSDSGWKDVYGKGSFYPEVSAGIKVYEGLRVMCSYGWLSRNGKTPTLQLDTQGSQRFASAGLAYIGPISGLLHYDVEAGLVSASFREEALDTIAKGNTLGFKAEGGLLLMGEGGQIFVGIKAGYISASTTVSDVRIKLGGLKFAVCLGIQLFGYQ